MPYSYFPNDVMMSLEHVLVAQKSVELKLRNRTEGNDEELIFLGQEG